jgi:hypothetical protein
MKMNRFAIYFRMTNDCFDEILNLIRDDMRTEYTNYSNQPTEKLTKGGVLRKRTSSSLARLNHSCVRNA